jgi:hypothetical protein
VLNGLQTFRHDHAAHVIYQLLKEKLTQTRKGKWHIFIAAGKRYADVDAPLECTIPKWALPNNAETPDLVIIDGWTPSDPVPSRADFKNISFTIIDVAYGRGDTSTTRITTKQRKYAPLVGNLRAAGFTVHGAQLGSSLFPDARNPQHFGASFDHVAVISLGITGEIYSNIYSILGIFDISRRSLAPLLLRLHTQAIRHTCKILRTRRSLDCALRRSPVPASGVALPGGVG